VTSSDNDIVPLAIELAQANEDGWDRSLFELFPATAPTWPTRNTRTTRMKSRPSCSAVPRNCCTACASKCRARAARHVPARRSLGTGIFS
jgi:hypothetical protein